MAARVPRPWEGSADGRPAGLHPGLCTPRAPALVAQCDPSLRPPPPPALLTTSRTRVRPAPTPCLTPQPANTSHAECPAWTLLPASPSQPAPHQQGLSLHLATRTTPRTPHPPPGPPRHTPPSGAPVGPLPEPVPLPLLHPERPFLLPAWPGALGGPWTGWKPAERGGAHLPAPLSPGSLSRATNPKLGNYGGLSESHPPPLCPCPQTRALPPRRGGCEESQPLG